MANITIYTTLLCPYCHRAKALLRKKGASFTEVDVGMDPAKRAEMTAKANGRHTVPQVFIDGVHVGGSDDLHALDTDGKLDQMLHAAGAPA